MRAIRKLKSFAEVIASDGSARQLTRGQQIVFISIGLLFSLYQIWSVIFSKMDPINQMSIHLAFVLVLTFFLFHFSNRVPHSKLFTGIDGVFIVLATSCGVYYFIHADRIAMRAVGVDPLTTWDIIFGLIFVLLSIEAARRTIGFAIILVALLFIAYALFGHLLGGIWFHHEMSPVEVLDQLAFSFNGLWGSPIAVAASFVFIFVLFGAFLQHSGASEFFFKLSVAIAGRTRGGAAKIAIIASAFFGTISGSPTANVVTTGPFTIPMAKRLGYSPRFAAAIEACASTGGSLLPPIMGSSAFLMAAVTGISYPKIAIAATLPAILFYVSLFSVVHFEALRIKLPRTEAKDIPKLGTVLKEGWTHFIPVILLVSLLFKGMSPSRTGFYGILAIIIISWFRKEGRMGIPKVIKAMASGAKSAIPISTACAAAGMVIAGIMATGLGGKLNSIILSITAGQMLPSLLLIMVMCIILGMGMPVAAAYVLTAMLAAPALIDLGVSPLAAHLFIVYFSIISAITPPVAVAAFAAAGIAEENPTKVGIEAVRVGLASFIIPFVFVYDSALLLDGTMVEIIYAFLSTTIGIVVLGCGVVGFFYRATHVLTRTLLITAGLTMIFPSIIFNLLGITIVILLFFMQTYHKKRISKETSVIGEQIKA